MRHDGAGNKNTKVKKLLSYSLLVKTAGDHIKGGFLIDKLDLKYYDVRTKGDRDMASVLIKACFVDPLHIRFVPPSGFMLSISQIVELANWLDELVEKGSTIDDNEEVAGVVIKIKKSQLENQYEGHFTEILLDNGSTLWQEFEESPASELKVGDSIIYKAGKRGEPFLRHNILIINDKRLTLYPEMYLYYTHPDRHSSFQI